jgi:methylated-DNA-[protein]-cysteine S-methyltransferase
MQTTKQVISIMINSQKIYDLLSEIPKGKVTTYKVLAKMVKTKGYRAIGQIVGANPNAPKVPCHRVVRSDGGLGGYAFGLKKKIELLTAEGVKIADGKVIDFEKKFYDFKK